jgi:hypothetical protein
MRMILALSLTLTVVQAQDHPPPWKLVAHYLSPDPAERNQMEEYLATAPREVLLGMLQELRVQALSWRAGQPRNLGLVVGDLTPDPQVQLELHLISASPAVTGRFVPQADEPQHITAMPPEQVTALLEAVADDDGSTVVTSPRVICFDSEPATITATEQVQYISDYTIEQTEEGTASQPIFDTVTDGVVIEATPVVSRDRTQVTVEVHITKSDLVRPIQTITTTVPEVEEPLEIQLPEVTVREVETRVRVATGTYVLLGGLEGSGAAETDGTQLLLLLRASVVAPKESER